MWDENELAKLSNAPNPFPLLADPCAHIGKLFGVFNEDAQINLRGSFVIDPDGIVQSMEILAAPVGRDFDETLRQIAAHQLVCETKGSQVAPTGWSKGKAVLEPGPQLVGKVWENWKLEG